MNRIALTLAALGTPGLLVLPFATTSELVPFVAVVGLVALGGVTAIAGAATGRVRVHGAGIALAITGAGLTGVGLPTAFVGLGVASATLFIASLNLHLVLPEHGGGVTLVFAALVSSALVAALGLLAGRGARFLGGGGVDAAGGVAAWLVLVAAVTWGLVRWAQEAQPG
ncbi:hypothetical protein BRD56_11570 [Thermoplasmatales archaeon SW_10_69_26]|nr:MAG: hypothetical protein BRD56_11570 [Thermoplasmatales archaeon SW_10_69_26]